MLFNYFKLNVRISLPVCMLLIAFAKNACPGEIRTRKAAAIVEAIPAPSKDISSSKEKPAQKTQASWPNRILFYIPNRTMDLLDIFRLRLRAGPGLAANLRLTDYGAFYIGSYNAVYIGLPGARYPRLIRWPVGRESLSGVIMAGVDATDNTAHGPEYGIGEANIGLHFLVAGLEAGLNPVEMADFFAGFFFIDLMGDDYPRKASPPPKTTSGVSIGTGVGPLAVDPKPDTFESFGSRLDYLQLNVHRRVAEPLKTADTYFAVDPTAPVTPPETQFRLSLYTTFREGKTFEMEFSPDISIDVELPNIQQRLRVFVETARANELPERHMSETDEKGFNIGARKLFENLHLSTDAGVRAKWLPEAFVRLIWKQSWKIGEWDFKPEQKLFYETDDGLGALSSLSLTRWLGNANQYVFFQNASGKVTTKKDEIEWAGSLNFAQITSMLHEDKRGRYLDWSDTTKAQGIQYSIFGEDGQIDQHQISLSFRNTLYHRWIFWELDPGAKWKEEDDYKTAYFIRIGLEMLFQ